MQKNAICECLRDDRVTALTQILKQYWKKQQYDYFDRPRPFYGLMLLLQGSVRFVFEGGELIARAGELVFLPQEARYAAIFEDEAKDYLVNFEMQGVSVPVSVPTLLFQNAPAEVRGRFADLVWAGRSGAASALKCKAQFYFLLDEISYPHTCRIRVSEYNNACLFRKFLYCFYKIIICINGKTVCGYNYAVQKPRKFYFIVIALYDYSLFYCMHKVFLSLL
jgi:hypothetical protein